MNCYIIDIILNSIYVNYKSILFLLNHIFMKLSSNFYTYHIFLQNQVYIQTLTILLNI